ncbi:hypothetical protein DCS_06689 [Drechmeria coniospora]|uniref:RRM domain-containing protein n=1 Tax=Drechmeria coniospora TaxID=98403 RepID=A0A151GCA0_DRECN|nr:hypothetical protein DCS_06689 [Drechmeria coniospora]KYK54729.1 hypothetical protein DCS_06689 [Drechmeria coniospora]
MSEPEADLKTKVQIAANLFPASHPPPIYTATPLVVPSLQNTINIVGGMVATATTLADPNVIMADQGQILDPATAGAGDELAGHHDDIVVDDDSLNDPYDDGDIHEATSLPAAQPQAEVVDGNDDYARTFDSPIEPEVEDAQDATEASQSVPKPMQPESQTVSAPVDPLNADGRPSSVPVQDAAHDASAMADQGDLAPATVDDLAAQSQVQTDPALVATGPSQAPGEPEPQVFAGSVVSSAIQNQDVVETESQGSSLDIQQLVADLTSQAAQPGPGADPSTTSDVIADASAVPSFPIPSPALPSPSTLPPRPPLPQSIPQPSVADHPDQSHVPASNGGAIPSTPTQPASHAASGTEVTSMEVAASATSLTAQPLQAEEPDYQRQWEQFTTDESQYISEANWERFPEGSRIFIGNLSSDKVSKEEVFKVFHRYGRVAQISMKQAYGFVQYHTLDEGRAAMENLQGAEIQGRRIHLEVSRRQKKSKKDRARSPDRGRGRDAGRRNEKQQHQGRDEHRQGRNHSPRRNDHHRRDEGFGRDRGSYDGGRGKRGRSRSPAYGRNDRESYRRRSPSPYSRPQQEPELDLPRRYGADIPDVQLILQPDVNRDFATWVEGAFKAKGLKSEIMYLHPRMPKEQIVQRQAAEGVHAVVDLDFRAQSRGRIPVQAFDRSAGGSNVRFDQYLDLDPPTAAEVILRAKASGNPSYGQGYGPGGGYSNQYGQQPSQPSGYPGAQHPGMYPQQQQQQQQQQQPHAPQGAVDIANLMGQVDNATLQRLLSSIQPSPSGAPGAPTAYGASVPAANAQVDIQAILGSLGGGAPSPAHAPPHGLYTSASAPSYGAQQPPNAAPGSGDPAAQAQVQNIMAQLARYRQ